MTAIEDLARDPASRRRFLKGVGGAGAAGSFALLLAACGKKKQTLTPGGSNPKTGAGLGTDRFGKGDLGIVIYALTLEYVESDFYAKAIASGKLTGSVLDMAKRFAAHEAQHAAALETVVGKLGGQPPSKPQTQFTLDSQATILQQAVIFENLGASAYLGQADRIVSKELLAAALSIHAVEGRHAAALAVAANMNPTPQGAFAQPETAFNVIQSVEPNIV
jgi:rubrerythrin